MEERKRQLPSEDGSKMPQSCRKKIKFWDELVNSTKKKKKAKQHDIPDDVREKLRPHKNVKYMEDCSSQYDDDDDDDSDYYPSSQDSQVSLLEMGIKRIQSVNNVEERRKEKIETSCGVINKKEPKLEERRKEKMETTSTMINKHQKKMKSF